MVKIRLPTLASQTVQVMQELRQLMVSGQLDLVIWVDNWYWERYLTNPANPVASQNVTVFGVLLLSSTEEGPLAGTRSHRLPQFAGHLSLHHLTVRVQNAAPLVLQSTAKLIRQVSQLAAHPIQASSLRVPLDIRRPSRQSLQWRSLTVSQQRVSTGPELVQVLEDVRQFQQLVQKPTPLLMDEKVHYSVSRLSYSRSFEEYDVSGWLRQIPRLYGVWHLCKQTVHLVYRTFFPLFALLESIGMPQMGTRVQCQWKVLYMEKICATLLFGAHSLLDEVEFALMYMDQHTGHVVFAHSHHNSRL